MKPANRSRRIVALAAAYVIGLQALLLPLSVAAGGMFVPLCSGQASVGTAQTPLGHDNGCPCAAGCGMQCGVHALAGPPANVIAFGAFGVASQLPPLAIVAAPPAAEHRPQLARAPPAA
jgi:hypothetical protein